MSANASPVALSARTLHQWQQQQRPLVVLDARARLMDAAAGEALWREGHVPGAFHADMGRDLSAPPSDQGGRHPLPDKADFAARLRAWGISPEQAVVVYDDTGGQIAAARAWWMLNWAGHPAAHVLDGGWQAWLAAGLPTESRAPATTASHWQPAFNDALIASADDVAQGRALLLDARAGERYRGESEPLDPVAGHIPGARNLPGPSLLSGDLCFQPSAALQSMLPDADEVIAYCGSGVSACQLILGYALAGRPLPRLYPGSWSAWSRDPSRPVATGEK